MGHHSYWDPSLTDSYLYHAIACQMIKKGDGTEFVFIRDKIGLSMNHWIGGIRKGDPDQFKHDGLHINFPATVQMSHVYDGKGVHLLQTVADGDCGIDLCTVMLDWERTAANRQKVRDRLWEVAFKSMGNRAFVYLMYNSGEITDHMGLHDLENSFCDLLEMQGVWAG